MMVGPAHTLAHQEFRGPLDYRYFRACWDVYQMAMIMVEVFGGVWGLVGDVSICISAHAWTFR